MWPATWGLGLHPLFISRIGQDPESRPIHSFLEAWNLSSWGLQTDPHRPTGSVTISQEHEDPCFAIPAGQAYDAVDADSAVRTAGASIGLLYHGTLALRDGSRNAWKRFCPEPRTLKLTRGELAILTEQFCPHGTDPPRCLEIPGQRFGLQEILLTQDRDGAIWWHAGEL